MLILLNRFQFRARMNTYIPRFFWDVITYACPKLTGNLANVIIKVQGIKQAPMLTKMNVALWR